MDIFDYGEYLEVNREEAEDADKHYDPDKIVTPDEPEEEDY